MRLLAQCDGGGSFGEREAGLGVILIDRDTGELVWQEGGALGFITNNEAEYLAVFVALVRATVMGCTDIVIQSDSKLVVNQINGEWVVHKDHIAEYHAEVMKELEGYDKVKVEWIPRASNKLADSLARGAVS